LDRKDARTKLLNWDYSGFSQGGWLHSEPFHYTPTEQSNNQTENSNQILIFLLHVLSGLLFSQEKEGNPAICGNIDGTRGYFV
jgi:hypothetical protein